jgi:hypothetical protein
MTNRFLTTLLTLLTVFGGVLAFNQEAEAQLIVVEDKYRIVNVDRAGQRIGVAKPSAKPNVRQTWVYIKPSTTAAMRSYYGNGLFRDEQLSFNGIFNAAEQRKGQVIKIHGGRDFDGSIDAKKVWF